jgi:HK97 family phage portal protein
MNILERMANIWGRATGSYRAGVINTIEKASPSPNDATAFMDSRYWGEGLMTTRRPQSKAELVAQFQSWIYICASLNAKTIASVPLRLYVTKNVKGKKFQTIGTKGISKARLKWLEGNAGLSNYLLKAEEIEEVTEHAFLDLMDNVNPFNNSYDLWETTSTFLDLTGEAYWYLPKGQGGVPAQIWVIPSPYIQPIPGTTLQDFIKGYKYERGTARIEFSTDDIVYFSYPNPKNMWRGFSCIQGIADAVYINSKMYEFESAMFENRARVGGIFTVEGNVSKQEVARLEEQAKEKYTGVKQSGKNMILTGGMKFQPDSMTPQEISYIEGRKLIREEICAAFDVPVGALVSTDVNRANAETADYRHAKNGIQPRLMRIEQKLNEKLLPMFDDTLFCAFDNAVPEDREYELRRNDTYVKNNTFTINEVREEEGKDPVEWGDVAWMDSFLKPVSSGEERESPPAPALIPGKPEEDVPIEESLAGKVLEKVKERLSA